MYDKCMYVFIHISWIFFFYIDNTLKWASLLVQLVKNLPAMQETPVRFLGREKLLEKG